MKYVVTKAFFKLSERKNYVIGDFIELCKEDAEALSLSVEEVKETKKTKKND